MRQVSRVLEDQQAVLEQVSAEASASCRLAQDIAAQQLVTQRLAALAGELNLVAVGMQARRIASGWRKAGEAKRLCAAGRVTARR